MKRLMIRVFPVAAVAAGVALAFALRADNGGSTVRVKVKPAMEHAEHAQDHAEHARIMPNTHRIMPNIRASTTRSSVATATWRRGSLR